MNRAIISFYTRVGTDAANRTANDVHAFGHAELEGHHDFVQWLFPLDVPSAAISQSPILEPSEITEFRASPALRERLLMSLDLMLDFYGFERKQTAISRSATWDTRSMEWVTCRNHNYLQMTYHHYHKYRSYLIRHRHLAYRQTSTKGASTRSGTAVARMGPIARKIGELTADTDHVDGILSRGAERASAIAKQHLCEIQDIIGLLRS